MTRTPGLGAVGRPADRRDQTRELVLDTALRLFDEHGYLGVRVADIAEQAGVSRATFYKHFSEREQILAELLERLLGSDASPVVTTESVPTASVQQQIVALVDAWVQRMLEQEQLAKFVYNLPVRHSALLRPGATGIPAAFTEITVLLQRAAEQGDVRDDLPADLLARHVLAALETGMRDWAEGRVDDPSGRVGQLLDLALHGMARS